MRLRSIVVVAGCVGVALINWSVAPAWAKRKPAEKIYVVQDFEAPHLSKLVRADRMSGERIALAGKDAGHAYRCSAPGGDRVCWLSLGNVPKDVTAYRALRFRIRGEGVGSHPFHIRILNVPETLGLSGQIDGLSAEWKTVEILLPAMHPKDDFDPTKVAVLEFLWFKPPAFSFEVDDVQLVEVKGAGGWRYSGDEMIVQTFGAKRSKKVKRFRTEHFDIYTDSSAARKKFPKALEKTYAFVRTTLGLPEFEHRLPVYIHQNSELYFDFCVRHVGWSLESARNSAGYGSGRYFTTYYQSPKSDVVTHELTHSIFHRSVGVWGGSWLQEGAAVYVEHLAVKKSAAREFAPILRSGRHRPLREFITIDRLIDARTLRGGSSEAGDLYLQAGALFEFFLRSRILQPRSEIGPIKKPDETLPKAIFELAEVKVKGAELVKKVEVVFSMSIEDLEKAWIKWGSRPPKAD